MYLARPKEDLGIDSILVVITTRIEKFNAHFLAFWNLEKLEEVRKSWLVHIEEAKMLWLLIMSEVTNWLAVG